MNSVYTRARRNGDSELIVAQGVAQKKPKLISSEKKLPQLFDLI